MIEMNPVAAVIAHRDTVQEDLIDMMRENPVAALLIPGQPQVLNLDPPQRRLRVSLPLWIIDLDRRLPFRIDILDMRRRAASFNQNVFLRDSQRLTDFK